MSLLLLEAAAKSKVPFYVAGALLATWAVVVSVLGFRRPDFPGSPSRARAVMGISFAFVAGAISLAVVTATREEHKGERAPGPAAVSPPAAPAAPAARAPSGARPSAGAKTTLALAADPSGQLAFDTKTLSAKAGSVTIAFANKSPVPHNVTIAQVAKTLAASQTITSSSATVTTQLAPGTYTFYCSVDAHRQAGMEGTLTVQ